MKTPREILLGHHRKIESRLNEVRKAALATAAKQPPESPRMTTWREWLHSLRWHAVGMGAAWLFILFLHLAANHPSAMMAAIPPTKIPPPRVILASLRENRRLLLEMMETNAPAAKPLDLFPTGPRSERREEMMVA